MIHEIMTNPAAVKEVCYEYENENRDDPQNAISEQECEKEVSQKFPEIMTAVMCAFVLVKLYFIWVLWRHYRNSEKLECHGGAPKPQT